jgi:hypothetical protein
MKVAEGICWFYKLTQRRFLPSGKEPTYLTTSVQADLCDRLKEKHGKAGLSQFTIRQSGRRSDSDCEIGDVHGIPQPVTFLLLVSVGFLIGHFFCSPSNFCWRINKCVPCIFCSSKFLLERHFETLFGLSHSLKSMLGMSCASSVHINQVEGSAWSMFQKLAVSVELPPQWRDLSLVNFNGSVTLSGVHQILRL